MTYKSIIAAVEPEDENTAVIQRAALLARRCNASLTVATAIPDLRALYHGAEARVQRAFDQTLIDTALDGLTTLCRQAKVQAQNLLVLRGDAGVEIAAAAAKQRAGIIVFGNHDRHGLEHFVGGFGLGLLHRAHCDLLAVNLHGAAGRLAKPVVALGDDASDPRVLKRARYLFPDGTLEVVHVVRPTWLENNETEEAANTQVARKLEPILAKVAPTKLNVVRDKPSQGIGKAAERSARDLIIMGSGRHSQIGWHLGSTAHNVLSRTHIDVLLVRPEKEKS